MRLFLAVWKKVSRSRSGVFCPEFRHPRPAEGTRILRLVHSGSRRIVTASSQVRSRFRQCPGWRRSRSATPSLRFRVSPITAIMSPGLEGTPPSLSLTLLLPVLLFLAILGLSRRYRFRRASRPLSRANGSQPAAGGSLVPEKWGTPHPSNRLPRGVARRSKSQRGPEFGADSEPVLFGEIARNMVHCRSRQGHKEAAKQ